MLDDDAFEAQIKRTESISLRDTHGMKQMYADGEAILSSVGLTSLECGADGNCLFRSSAQKVVVGPKKLLVWSPGQPLSAHGRVKPAARSPPRANTAG